MLFFKLLHLLLHGIYLYASFCALYHLEGELERSRKEQSFFVPVKEIRDNGYDLSYKRYHEVEREAVVYDVPEVIIARMEERQKQIDAAFAEFQKLLNS